MFRVVQLASPVIVQDVPEDIWISVEKVFLSVLVVEKFSLVGTQQRVWVLFYCVAPRLEPTSTYINYEFFVLTPPLWGGYGRCGQWVARNRNPADGRRSCERQPSGHRGHGVTTTTHTTLAAQVIRFLPYNAVNYQRMVHLSTTSPAAAYLVYRIHSSWLDLLHSLEQPQQQHTDGALLSNYHQREGFMTMKQQSMIKRDIQKSLIPRGHFNGQGVVARDLQSTTFPL